MVKKILFLLIFNIIFYSNTINANIFSGRENTDYNFAARLFEQDYSLAARQFEIFIEKYPRSSYLKDAYFWSGVSYLNINDFENAAVKFQFVIDNFNKSDRYSPALFNLGLTYYKTGKYLLSAEYFKKLIEYDKSAQPKFKNPDNYLNALNYLGDCNFNLERYSESANAYSEYLEKSKNPFVEYKLFKTYFQQKKYSDAFNLYTQTRFDKETALFDDTETIKLHIYLGDIFFMNNNFAEAENAYMRTLNKNTSELINLLYLKLSQTAYVQKKSELSIQYLQKLNESKYQIYKNEAYNKIALIYYSLDNYDSSIFYLNQSIENYPDFKTEESILLLNNLYFQMQKYPEIIHIFENFVKPNSNRKIIENPEIKEKTAFAYYKLNKYSEAINLATAIPVSNTVNYYNIKFIEILCNYNLKNTHRTITELKLFLANDKLPESLKYKSIKLLADAYYDLNEFTAAEQYYTQIINVEIQDIDKLDVLAKLGLTYLKQKKFTHAETLIKNILSSSNTTAVNFHNFVLVYCESISDIIKKEYYLNELVKYSGSPEITDNAFYLLSHLNFIGKKYNISLSNLKKMSGQILKNEQNYMFALNYNYLNEHQKSLEHLNEISDYSNDTDKIAKLYILNLYALKQYRQILQKTELLSTKEAADKLFYSGLANFYLENFSGAYSALDAFLKKYNISDKHYDAVYHQAVAAFNLKKYNEAGPLLLKLDNINTPKKYDYQKYLSYIYLFNNNPVKALQTITAFETQFKNSLTDTVSKEINFIKAQIYFNLKNYKQSLEFINQIKNPENLKYAKDYFLLKADNHQSLFEYAQANANYSKYLELTGLENQNLILSTKINILTNLFKLEKYQDVINSTDSLLEKSDITEQNAKILIIQKAKAYFQLQKFDETLNYLNKKNYEDNDFNLEKSLLIASALFNKKDYPNAVKIYREILNKYPDNRYELDIKLALIQNYKLMSDTKNYEILQLEIINSPDAGILKNEAIIELSNFYQKNNNYDSAVLYAKKIINSSSSKMHLEKSYRIIITSYFEMKDYQQAIDNARLYLTNFTDISQAISKNEIRQIIAESLFAVGNFKQAIAEFKSITQPNDYISFKIILAYYHLNDYQNIINETEKFSNQYSNSAFLTETNYLRAFSYYKTGGLKKAADLFIQIIDEIKSGDHKKIAAKIIAENYSNENDKLNAVKWLDKSLQFESAPDFNSLYKLAESYYELNDYQNAAKISEQITRQFPDTKNNIQLIAMLSDCYLKFKDYSNALKTIELINNKNSLEFVEIKGAILEQSNNISKAADLYKNYIDNQNIIDKNNEKILIRLADILNKSDIREYQSYLKNIIDSKEITEIETLGALTLKLADIYYENQNYNEAILYYWKIILEQNAKNIFEYAYYKIILCYVNTNDLPKAKIQLSRFESAYPNSVYLSNLKEIEALKND